MYRIKLDHAGIREAHRARVVELEIDAILKREQDRYATIGTLRISIALDGTVLDVQVLAFGYVASFHAIGVTLEPGDVGIPALDDMQREAFGAIAFACDQRMREIVESHATSRWVRYALDALPQRLHAGGVVA